MLVYKSCEQNSGSFFLIQLIRSNLVVFPKLEFLLPFNNLRFYVSSSLWLQCLDSLKNEIPATEFSMWVRPLQADHDNNTLTLYAPNRFVLDWVQEKYLNDINRLVNEYSETKLVLRF